MTRPLPEGGQNDRFRDLVDLLLMREIVEDHAALAMACEEVFAHRGTHAWPPPITAPGEWRDPFARMAGENDLPIRDLDAAVATIALFVDQIVETRGG